MARAMKLPDLIAEANHRDIPLRELTGTPKPSDHAVTGPGPDVFRPYLAECVDLDAYLEDQGIPNV